MTSLETFAAHAERMVKAEHKPECVVHRPSGFTWMGPIHPDPDCPGCNPYSERMLWASLAAEIRQHQAAEAAGHHLAGDQLTLGDE